MDARKKKVLIVLSVASLILVWRVYAVVTAYMPSAAQAESSEASTDAANQDLVASVAARALEQESLALVKAQEKAAKQPWGRDPFADVVAAEEEIEPTPSEKAPVSQPPPVPTLTFTGVSKVGDEWRAIVSGRLVRIGDIIETDYRVSRITKRSITFQSRGWTLQYELGKEAPLVQPLTEKP